MDVLQFAIKHMNEEHQDANLTIAKYYGNLKDAKKAIVIKIEPKTLHLLVDNEITIEVPFRNIVDENNIKDEIISLLNIARENIVEKYEQEDLPKEIQEHMAKFKSVILATADKTNQPYASYAPFIKVEEKNYIYISSIAEHYQNLIDNPKLEVLFLEDESNSKIITARKRVKFKSLATKLSRNISNFEAIMDKMQEKHGNTIKMIRKFNDFNLFEINFIEGRYVKGFGQAYKIIPVGNYFKTESLDFEKGMPHLMSK